MKVLLRILGALVALCLVCVVVLLVMGRRADAGKGEVTIEIARPPETVWAWMTEPDKLTQWVAWLTAVEYDSTTAMGVGHREVWVVKDPNMKDPMRITAVVTAEDAPRTGAAHVEVAGQFTGEVSYTVTDIGGGRTRLTQKTAFRYLEPTAAFLEPLITPAARKKQLEDFGRLKQMAEAAPAAPATPATP